MEAQQFFIIRTSPAKEQKLIEAADQVLAKKEDHGIVALFAPESVKGYIFAEGESYNKVMNSLRGVPNFKGVVSEVSFEELSKYFEKEGEQVNVNERDIVEVISGPFKGDRAKVVRIVPGKDEIVIEPVGMAVPIPVTLSRDDIRVIENPDETQTHGEN